MVAHVATTTNVPMEAITAIQILRVKTQQDRSHARVTPGFVVTVDTVVISMSVETILTTVHRTQVVETLQDLLSVIVTRVMKAEIVSILMSVLSIATFVVLTRLVTTVPAVITAAVTMDSMTTVVNVKILMNVDSKTHVIKMQPAQIRQVVTAVNASPVTLEMAKTVSI